MERVSRSTSGYDLFFVMPRRGKDVHKSAKRLMGVRQVKEVLITEGDYGFVVRAESANGSGQLERAISRIVGGSTRMAFCHYQYRK